MNTTTTRPYIRKQQHRYQYFIRNDGQAIIERSLLYRRNAVGLTEFCACDDGEWCCDTRYNTQNLRPISHTIATIMWPNITKE
jgi:hypothetical protein